jgi:hypothetical protein
LEPCAAAGAALATGKAIAAEAASKIVFTGILLRSDSVDRINPRRRRRVA